jgi:hypothetical protein
MPHLIEVIDNALDPDLCQQWLATFDSSPHQRVGKTGGGIDVVGTVQSSRANLSVVATGRSRQVSHAENCKLRCLQARPMTCQQRFTGPDQISSQKCEDFKKIDLTTIKISYR